MKTLRAAVFLAGALASFAVFAQSTVLQGGPWAPGHAPMYSGSGGSQPVVQDSGGAGGGAAGVGLSELGITARGTGTPPYVSQGKGPLGTNFCNYDAPTTNAGGYHYLCMSPNVNGAGIIAYGAGGGAAAQPLTIDINGTSYPLGLTSNVQYATTNAALQLRSTADSTPVIRLGVATQGDAPPLLFTPSSAACSLNSGNGDIGSQVRSANGGCWLAAYGTDVDAREFGAVPDSGAVVDSGPGLRAACAYVGTAGNGRVVALAPGMFVLKTLDGSGLGAIVIGTGTSASPPCSMRGLITTFYPDDCYGSNIPTLLLGDGLNRPLIYHRKQAATSILERVCLSGNRANQTGWAGGPTSRLYVVQVEDYLSPVGESAVSLKETVVRDGYNGSYFLGAGRGGAWIKDTWFQYSGHDLTDFSVFLQGYDATFNNAAIGGNTGGGIYMAQGSQYQFTDGAIFFNTADGMTVNGGKVGYLSVSGINFQYNGCNGVHELSSGPYAGTSAAGHMFVNVTFDGNSRSSTNVCSDVVTDNALPLLAFANVSFVGSTTTSDPKAKYNIRSNGGGTTRLSNPVFSAVPNATAWTNFENLVMCSNCTVTNTWTPVLAGATTPGTPTYVSRVGSWTRNNNTVTATFNVTVSSLGGAAGLLTLTGLPIYAANVAGTSGACAISSYSGWTAAAGYTTLGAFVGLGSDTVYFNETASTKSAAFANASEFAANTTLSGSCTYNVE